MVLRLGELFNIICTHYLLNTNFKLQVMVTEHSQIITYGLSESWLCLSLACDFGQASNYTNLMLKFP